MGFIELLQLPLESIFALILPVVGVAGDVVFDGAEGVIGTVLVATLLMPHLAPATIVQQIRAERASVPELLPDSRPGRSRAGESGPFMLSFIAKAFDILRSRYSAPEDPFDRCATSLRPDALLFCS